jgi:Zincin-like metallopeptidase
MPPPGALCTIVSRVPTWVRRIRSATVDDGDDSQQSAARIRRRDRHGRGLRGLLVPPEVPLYGSRSEHFDDLVLLAVSQLEPRWEAELAGVEFGVEEIPPAEPASDDPEPVPLARTEPPTADADGLAEPARIVLYRRPLMARAEDEDELSELVFDVVVEEFAEILGVDPEIIDPGYGDLG